jgi:hypothetical protein
MRHTLVLNGHFAAGDRFSIVVVPLHAGRYICGLVADRRPPKLVFRLDTRVYHGKINFLG